MLRNRIDRSKSKGIDMKARENMSVVIVGHVDHGKSTIIGRLLADTGSLPEGKLEQVRENCMRNSKPFEYAFLLDALKEEQAQGITIDAARCFFKSEKRNYMIIDAPGHIEFLKNMVTGAARAEAALLVIDAVEGIMENSRRHGYMLSLLGISQIAVVVNKIDMTGYSKNVFNRVVNEYSDFLEKINVKPRAFIPVSGMLGDCIASCSQNMPWYKGKTVLEQLDEFEIEKMPDDKPFRLPVQGVYKFTRMGDNRRIVAGTIETGKLNVGDEVVFCPSGKKSRVKSIEAFSRQTQISASAGQPTGFILEEQIYVRRGEIAAKYVEKQPISARRFRASIFWLGKNPMEIGGEYLFKLGTARVRARLEKIIRIIDVTNLEERDDGHGIYCNEVAECILKTDKTIAFDIAEDIAATSRFVLVDSYEISGGGIIRETLEEISAHSPNTVWIEGAVSYEDRCRLLSQQGLVVWFTGLSGSGKSTIAIQLENELVRRGKLVYRIDGDNIRHGLNSDLGFSEEDRNENIRRTSELAALMKDAGIITLVSLISPYKTMRDFARSRIKDGMFLEVYVKASLEICRKRDPKGLYERAENGEIAEFTGLTSPYEEPGSPDIVIDTEKNSIEQSVKLLMELIESIEEKGV